MALLLLASAQHPRVRTRDQARHSESLQTRWSNPQVHRDLRGLSTALPPLGDPVATARAVYDAVAGYGPLEPFLDDPAV